MIGRWGEVRIGAYRGERGLVTERTVSDFGYVHLRLKALGMQGDGVLVREHMVELLDDPRVSEGDERR